MTGKIEYLEKYSVAPSPSRDYYGLRVLRDQVILYLWKISHGPHKTPIVRTSSFEDFKYDKPLQDEIQRIFGKYLLKHIRHIADGRRNTLLTLPKCLTETLVAYLSVSDIVKLSSLSHAAKEVFNDKSVWETLYRKHKSLTRNKYEKLYAGTHDWKQLLQLAQMQGVMNELKAPRVWQQTSKQTRTNSKLEDTTKPLSVVSRGSSRAVPSAGQAPRKPSDATRRKPTQNPATKKSDVRLDRCTIDNEATGSERKVSAIKSFQTVGQKNLKTMRDLSKPLKTESKREVGGKDSVAGKPAETKQIKGQGKVRRTEARVSSTSVRIEDKSVPVKTRNITAPKARSEKPAPCSLQADQAKVKTRGKTKKIGQSKSTILRTNSALVAEHSAVRDDSFDVAELIEASLKNIRSPRSIFDYSFSCIEKPKACAGDSKAEEECRRIGEPLRGLKSGRARATLDRLSEKSEPLTAKSIDSINKSDASCGPATPRYVKTLKTKAKLSAEAIKNRYKIPMPEDKIDTLERYGIYNKYPTPRVNGGVEQKRASPQKAVDKMEVLRSLDANNSFGRRASSGRAGDVNRYNLRKAVGGIHKN